MISDRPGGGGGGGGGDKPSVSIGNYKGVMLCNRPFAGVSAAARKAGEASDGKVPFKSAVFNQEQLGLNPAKKIHAAPANARPKKETALDKHKRWLHDAKQAKERMLREQEETEQQKEEKRRKFVERQARLRQEVRQAIEEPGPDDGPWQADEGKYAEPAAAQDCGPEPAPAPAPAPAPEPAPQPARVVDEGKRGDGDGPAAAAAVASTEEEGKVGGGPELSEAQRRKVADNKSKPAWALTEQAREQLEDDEIEGLMNFAADLDIDKYLDDLEVRAAIETVKRRIDELESQKDGDETEKDLATAEGAYEQKYGGGDEEADGKTASPARKPGKLTKANLSKLAAAGGPENLARLGAAGGDDDDLRSQGSVATAMSDHPSLRGIHSKRSLAAVAKRQAEHMQAIREEPRQMVNIEPRIVVVDENEGARENVGGRSAAGGI